MINFIQRTCIANNGHIKKRIQSVTSVDLVAH